jgi:hypothetical protein
MSFTSQSSDDDDSDNDDDDDEDESVVVVFTISERRFLFAHHHRQNTNKQRYSCGTPRGGGAQKPKRYFSLSLSLSPKKTRAAERVLKEKGALCVRVCVVVTRKERERKECALHRAMMTMQNSSFFLSGVVVECKKRREKKFF